MKKYTNTILIITAIVLVLGMVIGYTVDFQTGYRSGRITYEERDDTDSLEMVLRDLIGIDDDTAAVETFHETSPQDEPASEKEPETSHQ